MAFCLPKFAADKLREALPKDISTLIGMTSEERHAFFAEHIGEQNSPRVNSLFESKLLLKNQQDGLVNWAKQVLGMKEQPLRDTLSKIGKMDKILQPTEMKAFLGDLASQRLGFKVSADEAKNIATLAKDVADRRSLARPDGTFPTTEDRLSYGLSLTLFQDYVGTLKSEAKAPAFIDYIKHPTEVVSALLNTTKSMLSTLDNSFFGRQGIKVLYTHPAIWGKAFLKSWGDIGKELAGKDATIPIKSDVYSRPNALNGKYKAGNYAIGINSEEAFPTSLPGRIPLFGRIFKGAEAAYNGGALRTRADLADKLIAQAEKSGIDVTDPEQAKSIGKVVNSLTGRGDIGRAGVIGKEINAAFFSIKFLKSNWDTLTGHQFDSKMTPYAKQIAAGNLVKIVASTAAVLSIANTLWPGSVETDPHSTNFGKIKIAGTTFDMTGGMASLITLAFRVAPLIAFQNSYTKNSAGKITPLNSGKFGASTGLDVVDDFWQGKLSPAAGVIRDLLKGQDYNGKKPTLSNILPGVFTPLPIQAFQQTFNNPKAADIIAVMLAETLGINTSSPAKK